MSTWKHAYGWSGHILVSSDEMDGATDDNVVAIPPEKFNALAKAYTNDEMDERIGIRQLGVTHDKIYLFATGSCFSEGFTHYGTVFEAAEDRACSGRPFIDHDALYLEAMKEIYGLDLPPCRLMIGCASEE